MSAVSFVETLFPPFPGDVLFVVMSGWASRAGWIIPPVAISTLAGFIGCFAASVIIILVGRRFGRGGVRNFLLSRVGESRLSRAETLVAKSSGLMLFISRFMPGIRSLLVLVAGYSGMRPALAAAYGGVSALLWYSLLSAAGAGLGYNLTVFEGMMNRYEILAWIVVGFAVMVWIAIRIVHRRCRRSAG
jgi:membrane protein DedA with SNARE-associated domain